MPINNNKKKTTTHWNVLAFGIIARFCFREDETNYISAVQSIQLPLQKPVCKEHTHINPSETFIIHRA